MRFLFAELDSYAVFCQDRNYLEEKVAAVFIKKFKLLRYIILKATTGVLFWNLADMNFWPQFLKRTYGGVWSFPKGFSVILSTAWAKVFRGTAIFGIIASKIYHCYIIMIHIQFYFTFCTFSFFIRFALVFYIFKFVCFFTKKIVLFKKDQIQKQGFHTQ